MDMDPRATSPADDSPTVALRAQRPAAGPPPPPRQGPRRAPEVPASNGWAVAALVLGIITLALSPVPVLNQVGILVGLVGVGLAVPALVVGVRREVRKVMAGVAMGLSVVGLVASFAFTSAYVAALDEALAPVPAAGGGSAGSVFPDRITTGPVTYRLEVTGSDSEGLVTWSNGTGGIDQEPEAAFPWTTEVTVDGREQRGVTLSGSTSSSATSGRGEITCTIYRDGQVVDTNTAQGQYASAHCDVY